MATVHTSVLKKFRKLTSLNVLCYVLIAAFPLIVAILINLARISIEGIPVIFLKLSLIGTVLGEIFLFRIRLIEQNILIGWTRRIGFCASISLIGIAFVIGAPGQLFDLPGSLDVSWSIYLWLLCIFLMSVIFFVALAYDFLRIKKL